MIEINAKEREGAMSEMGMRDETMQHVRVKR